MVPINPVGGVYLILLLFNLSIVPVIGVVRPKAVIFTVKSSLLASVSLARTLIITG